MKKLPVFALLLFFSLVSCQEDDPFKNKNLPVWLTESIQNDEEFVSQNPKSMLAYGVWVRTEWEGNNYFEYSNQLSHQPYPRFLLKALRVDELRARLGFPLA